jgi:hypothetical protein
MQSCYILEEIGEHHLVGGDGWLDGTMHSGGMASCSAQGDMKGRELWDAQRRSGMLVT